MTGPEHYQEAERLLERYADPTIAMTRAALARGVPEALIDAAWDARRMRWGVRR